MKNISVSLGVCVILFVCGAGFSWIVTKEFYDARYQALGDVRVIILDASGYKLARQCGDTFRSKIADKDHAASVSIDYITCVEGVVSSTEERRYEGK